MDLDVRNILLEVNNDCNSSSVQNYCVHEVDGDVLRVNACIPHIIRDIMDEGDGLYELALCGGFLLLDSDDDNNCGIRRVNNLPFYAWFRATTRSIAVETLEAHDNNTGTTTQMRFKFVEAGSRDELLEKLAVPFFTGQ
jgi:hypothetical protein